MKLRPVLVLLALYVTIAHAQTIHERETFSGLTNPQAISDTLPGPQYMHEHVVDGKLRLSLQDAVILALANNSQVRLQQLNVQNAKYGVLRAHSPFDPLASANVSALRSTSPTTNELQGAQTLSTLSQTMQFTYAQTFETGTNVQAGFGANKLSTNSVFNFLNPSYSSSLSFQFTQPLLRNGWLFANRAPLVIARRNLNISRATFAAQISDAILRVVTEYWGVVQARGNLEVSRKSLDQAEASYRRDKRALELGALPPLDIYRSESQVASRRVQVIQAEYALKQAEDLLRSTIGATIDPYFQALDLDLTESPEVAGELRTMDLAAGLQQALQKRPELEAIRQSVANDDTSIRLAHNGLLPDLRLTGNYSSNGVGGNSFDTSVSPPQLISPGGLGDSLSEVFGFGFPTYGVTLSLNLPIRKRGAQADLGNALVARRRDLYSGRQLREQITLEVGNAIHQLEEAKLSVAASKEALDLAQKNLAAEQRKYELGGQTIFFVLEAQTELAQAELGLLQAQVGYQIAVAAVDHATGDLLSPYGMQLADLNK
jgi:outer membrane protein